VTNDLDILGAVHFTQSRNGLVSRDFKIDPSKVNEIARDSTRKGKEGEVLRSFRYVIAIEGESREKAAHEFHDRVLSYPTAHGLLPFYRTQIGVAQLMLGVTIPTNGNKTKTTDLTPVQKKNIERVASFRARLHGHRMLVIRGAFKNEKEFVHAFQEAALSKPGQHLPIPELPSLFFDTAIYDPLIVAGDAMKTAGTIGKRIPPNIPGSRLVRLAGDVAYASGDGLQNAANRLQQLSLDRQIGKHFR